jgi:hypothetical protein
VNEENGSSTIFELKIVEALNAIGLDIYSIKTYRLSKNLTENGPETISYIIDAIPAKEPDA